MLARKRGHTPDVSRIEERAESGEGSLPIEIGAGGLWSPVPRQGRWRILLLADLARYVAGPEAKHTSSWTKDAAEIIHQPRSQSGYAPGGMPYQITNCPWCGAPSDPGRDIEVETPE